MFMVCNNLSIMKMIMYMRTGVAALMHMLMAVCVLVTMAVGCSVCMGMLMAVAMGMLMLMIYCFVICSSHFKYLLCF